jgi:hypothetical protein
MRALKGRCLAALRDDEEWVGEAACQRVLVSSHHESRASKTFRATRGPSPNTAELNRKKRTLLNQVAILRPIGKQPKAPLCRR